jgi:2-polyprenyl-3-methyl-5-hydroxy-6-metoxy-1,4-benzoquinol methylase
MNLNKELKENMDKVSDYYLSDRKLSTQKVMEILLGKSEKKEVFNSSNFVNFDMNEFLKWKELNNEKYLVKINYPIISHKKFIGKFVVFWKKIVRRLLRWLIYPIVTEQNEFNASVTASINAIYNNEIVTQEALNELHKQNNSLMKMENKLNEINGFIENDLLSHIKNCKAKEAINSVNTLSEKYENLEILFKEDQLSYENSQKIDNIEHKIEKLQENMNYFSYMFRKNKKNSTVEESNSVNTKSDSLNIISEEVEEKDRIDYFLFENKFRGTLKEIRENQIQYLKYYLGKKNILDIGAGRGEFLELLNENNISNKGIDVYKDFVEYCEEKGLNVEKADALSYMKELKNNVLGGIFMSQVAEHLDNDYLFDLVEESYKKLENGAYFIAETPNPRVLSTFTNSFYLDPTHVKPVHPETFKFIMEYVGFRDVTIFYTKNSKIPYELPLLNGDNIENLQDFNDGINLLNEFLFGSQDYAIIARK